MATRRDFLSDLLLPSFVLVTVYLYNHSHCVWELVGKGLHPPFWQYYTLKLFYLYHGATSVAKHRIERDVLGFLWLVLQL